MNNVSHSGGIQDTLHVFKSAKKKYKTTHMQFFNFLSQLPQLLFFRLYSLLVSLLLLPKLLLKNKTTVIYLTDVYFDR